KSGDISRRVTCDNRSQPSTRTASPPAPINKSRQVAQRSARYSTKGTHVGRIASHNAATTAGTPAITESEIANPLPATSLIVVARSIGPPRSSTKIATTATWPTNIATNTAKPQSTVPQNFQTRGSRDAGSMLSGELSGRTDSIGELSVIETISA